MQDFKMQTENSRENRTFQYIKRESEASFKLFKKLNVVVSDSYVKGFFDDERSELESEWISIKLFLFDFIFNKLLIWQGYLDDFLFTKLEAQAREVVQEELYIYRERALSYVKIVSSLEYVKNNEDLKSEKVINNKVLPWYSFDNGKTVLEYNGLDCLTEEVVVDNIKIFKYVLNNANCWLHSNFKQLLTQLQYKTLLEELKNEIDSKQNTLNSDSTLLNTLITIEENLLMDKITNRVNKLNSNVPIETLITAEVSEEEGRPNRPLEKGTGSNDKDPINWFKISVLVGTFLAIGISYYFRDNITSINISQLYLKYVGRSAQLEI